MVHSEGFEPPTFWFVAKHSIQLSYECINNFFNKNGGSSGNRTSDTRIFSPLLYRLSYEAKWRSRRGSNPRSSAWQANVLTSCTTRPQNNKLVAGAGFEPTTSGLWAQRATGLLYPAIWRRKRDSNPCAAYTTCRFSRPIPSARLGYSSIRFSATNRL